MDRVYLTQQGYEKMTKDLEYLKNTKRREIARALEHARSLGDLSENAEYDAAKEAFATNETKIKEVEDRLSRAEIISDIKTGTDNKAYLGSKVKLIDLDTNENVEYFLVGADEADPINGFLSIISPVGKSLLGRGVDDVIEIKVPAGTLKYKIIGISR